MITTVPNKTSTDQEWIDWHKAMQRHPKFKPALCKELFNKAWAKRESYKAATAKLRTYCRQFGVIIPEYSALEGMVGKISGIDPKTVASIKSGAITVVIIGFLAFLAYKFFGTYLTAQINANAQNEGTEGNQTPNKPVELSDQQWTYLLAGAFVLAVGIIAWVKWEQILIILANSPEEKLIREKILNGVNEEGTSNVDDILLGGKFDNSYKSTAEIVAKQIYDAKGNFWDNEDAVFDALNGKNKNQLTTIATVFEQKYSTKLDEYLESFMKYGVLKGRTMVDGYKVALDIIKNAK